VVTITNSCGTTITDSIRVNFNPPPTISIATDTANGCPPLVINFIDQSLTGNSSDPIISWLWNFGDGTTSTSQNPTHTYTATGTYSVTLQVVTSHGCQNSNSSNPVLITVHPLPQAIFAVSSSNLALPFDTLKCINQSIGANSYQWDFGDGYTSTQIFPEHLYTLPNNYRIQLVATNTYGCRDTAYTDITAYVNVIFPNGFSPDPTKESDGYYDPGSLDNNIFFPYVTGVAKYHLMIFDRWGELIFETHDVKQGWNGYMKGKICQQDVYVYRAHMEFFNGKTYDKIGDVTLVR